MTWLESIVLATAIAAAIVSALTFAPGYADDETLSIFGASILPAAQCAPYRMRQDISMRCHAHHQSCLPCHQGFANAQDFVITR